MLLLYENPVSMKNLTKIIGLQSAVFNSIHSQKIGQSGRKRKVLSDLHVHSYQSPWQNEESYGDKFIVTFPFIKSNFFLILFVLFYAFK